LQKYFPLQAMSKTNYNEDSIKSLDWNEHIRLRPGMYIGKLGDGSSRDDGIYVLVKEIIDNSIDEYVMGYGKKIEVTLQNNLVGIRDYGRGIPLGKVLDCVSRVNTGGKFDSKVFKKSVGLNGIGSKAVNALSEKFIVQSIREGKTKIAEFNNGDLVQEYEEQDTEMTDGTLVTFSPDQSIFENYQFVPEYMEKMFWNYAYLNTGLVINFNGQRFYSSNGLLDLLGSKTNVENILYPIIHLKNGDIEVTITHGHQYGEEYYSFVNGQFTTQGGTHLLMFKEAYVKTIREFYKRNFEPADIRSSIIAAISIRITEPVFESQTKTKLGSQFMEPNGRTIKSYITDFLKKDLDDYLHKNPKIAEILLKKIIQSEKERKEILGIKKMANGKAKKANIYNKKLRDCRIHFNDITEEKRFDSTLFITEGDSASGSITKSRDTDIQAVFSLKGKPMNCFGMKKNVVYENEEFNLLQHALDIEESIEGLRYNNLVIATDADVDGMHIRLLLLTFFLQYFLDVVKNGHVYILETPLFRVRTKNDTWYCYSEKEKEKILNQLGGKPEITRFKGLGEISPDEFGLFIGKKMRLEPVLLSDNFDIKYLLNYYMGKNTPERQDFVIKNLRVEKEVPVGLN
jgi:topoisomerase IV subunit B